jgi:hypothetical protein
MLGSMTDKEKIETVCCVDVFNKKYYIDVYQIYHISPGHMVPGEKEFKYKGYPGIKVSVVESKNKEPIAFEIVDEKTSFIVRREC